MKERHPLDLAKPWKDVVALMSEGNPGAINVMMQLLQGAEDSLPDIWRLDELNMRGPQIWVGFKDFAGGDVERFRQGIRDKDQSMIDKVNQLCAYTGQHASKEGRL